jgi:RHS repeat-associated protein
VAGALGVRGDRALATNPSLPADSISYGYDELGRLTTVIDPNAATNGVARYHYDEVGNITSIERLSSAGVSVVQLAPGRGAVGSSIAIYGTGFSATPSSNTVTFANSASATVTFATQTQLQVTVPAGAVTGTVSVTSPSGSATSSSSFTVVAAAQAPSVSGFSPAIGAPGTSVTVSGSHFQSDAEDDVVAIGQVRGKVSTASSSSLTFDVPTGATSGRLLVATPAGSGVSAGDLFVPPPGYSASSIVNTGRMSIGDLNQTMSFTDASKNGLMLFDGNAGQYVFLNNPSPSMYAAIKLFDPFGVQIGLVGVGPSGGYLDTIRLPTSGTYTILVDPSSGTGSVKLSLYEATPSTGTIAVNGQPHTVTGLTVGQNATRTFSGTQGQRVFVKAQTQMSMLTVRLRDSLGVVMGSTLLGTGVGATTAYIDTQTLPVGGTYTIEIDPSGTSTGDATVTLYDVPADLSGTITPGGSAQTLTFSTPGQNGTLTFAGTSGQRISLKMTNVTMGGCCDGADIAIKNPDGSTLASAVVGTAGGFIDTKTLASNGTYSLLVDPRGANTGSITLTLYNVVDDTGTMTIGGASSTMTLSTPGQNGTRTFGGTSGQAITLTLSSVTIGSGCCSAKVSIKNPDGSNLVSPTFFGPANQITVNKTLAATGTHTILIDPQGAVTGSVTLALTTSGGGGSPRALPRGGEALVAPAQGPSKGSDVTRAPSTEGDNGKPAGRSKARGKIRGYRPGSLEEWLPTSTEPSTWFSGRSPSPFEDASPLQARPGATAIAGQVLRLDGLPLAGVLVRSPALKTKTDWLGRFLLKGVRPGHLVMTIDASTANRRNAKYGVYEIGVEAKAGTTSVLPYTIWSPKLDVKHQIRLHYPLKHDVVLTTPYLPELKVRIPAGSEIHDRRGRLVHRLGITPVPLDRSPFPMPGQFPVYFTIQPGAAYVWPHGFEIVYPNKMHAPPGKRIDFYSYDPQDKGWFVYGKGTVTANGRQIVFDRGTRQYEITSSGVSIGIAFFVAGFYLGWQLAGDPVDLATGHFTFPHTDLVEPGTPQIDVSRVYRSDDTEGRALGVGTSLTYGMALYQPGIHDFSWADLYFADGSKVHYARISSGTDYTDMVLEAQSTPSAFYRSRITWNGQAFELRRTDGAVYTFANGGLLQSIRDRFGNQTTIRRSAGTLGDITQVLSSSGRWLNFTYSGSRITQAKDQSGRTVSYTYSNSRLWKVTDANGGVTEYTYDASGRMTTIKDQRNIVWLTNHYDANGRVDEQTLTDGATYEFAYTLGGNGNVTQTDVTTPGGVARRVTFNDAGHALSDTRAVGTPREQETTYEYQQGTNLLLAETDERDRRTEYEYNDAGKLTEITELAGTADAVSTSFAYEPQFQQLTSISDPLGHGPTFDYNARGALTKVTDARGKETTIDPNLAGQPVTVTVPLSNETTYGYTLGDRTSVEDALGAKTGLFYDSAGRLTHVTDALGETTSYGYDDAGALTAITDPAGEVTSLERDGNGNVTSVTDAKPHETAFTYDDMDRVATRTDPLLESESFEYDGRGNLTKATDRKGQVTTYAYDELDRLTFAGFGTTGPPESPSYESTIGYTYDNGNRLTEAVDSDAGTVTRTWDELDRLTSETTPEGSVSYGYDDADRRQTMTVDGQAQVSYGYDNADQLTSLTRGTLSAALAYDDASRPASVTLPNGTIESYSYDPASRLSGITYERGGSTLGELVYDYDATGLRTATGGSYARTGLPAAVTSTTYNAANGLTAWGSQSFSYDDNGNLTGDGTDTYGWNARDELASISGGQSASFAYDAFGRRTSRTVASIETRFLYDGANVAQELDAGGTPTANLVSGLGLDELFALIDGSGTHSLLTDALGSTLAIADGSGTIEAEYTYEPFGKASQTGSGGSVYQFTGRENDGTGLQFSRARYYDPVHGRFISEDPLGFGGGDVNLYAYVWNSPLAFTDPLGTTTHVEAQRPFGLRQPIARPSWLPSDLGRLGKVARWGGRAAGWAGAGWAAGSSARKFYVAFAETGESNGGQNGEQESESAADEATSEESTVADVLEGKKGSITRAPLPKGSPSWDEIRNLPFSEIVRRARANETGFKTILKLLRSKRFDK